MTVPGRDRIFHGGVSGRTLPTGSVGIVKGVGLICNLSEERSIFGDLREKSHVNESY